MLSVYTFDTLAIKRSLFANTEDIFANTEDIFLTMDNIRHNHVILKIKISRYLKENKLYLRSYKADFNFVKYPDAMPSVYCECQSLFKISQLSVKILVL